MRWEIHALVAWVDAPLPVVTIAQMDAIIRVRDQSWKLLDLLMVRHVTEIVQVPAMLAVQDFVPIVLVHV